MKPKIFSLIILSVVAIMPLVQAVAVYSQEQQTPTPRSHAEISALIEAYEEPKNEGHLSPRIVLGAFNDAKANFVNQYALYIRETEYEKAIARDEHPPVPPNYTSSSSRWDLVKSASRMLARKTRSLKDCLNLPANASMDQQLRKTMEEAFAHVLSVEGINAQE